MSALKAPSSAPLSAKLQPLVAFLEGRFMPAHLREQRRQGERAQRGSQHADLRASMRSSIGDAAIAEKADAEARYPDDGKGDDERRRRGVYRRAASRKPEQLRKQHRGR